MKYNNLIIASIVLSLFLSVGFLSFVEHRQHTPSGWWSVSFVTPRSDSLDFVIENFTTETSFTYDIVRGQEKVIDSGMVTVPFGDSVSTVVNTNEKFLDAQRLTVVVKDSDGNKKEIFRIFPEDEEVDR
ncbi:MAG: hypothetical protein KC736_01805 [Candidatus Moranbacteria bacterium]|nr:hypothetical protein [Candidatus Moranbacteria bacterium]